MQVKCGTAYHAYFSFNPVSEYKNYEKRSLLDKTAIALIVIYTTPLLLTK
ncbi:MAG: hypothetical protein PUP90_15535 [Nostoc sp. S4]|nr:hypothetical protein [Nostoc sp. S4]